MNDLALPEGWAWKKLGEVLKLNYGKALKSENRSKGDIKVYGSNGEVGFHNKYLIDFDTVVIGRKGSVGEANLSLGKSWIIDTAYYVEIEDPEQLDLFYFYNYAKNIDISLISQKGVKPGVNREDYLNILIPLPHLNEQRRIVAKIDAAFSRLDEAIHLQKQNIQRTEEMKKSVLEEVFGGGEWEVKRLGQVAEISRGKSKHRPRNDKSLFGGNYPFIQTGDVRNASKYITNFSETYNEKGLAQSKLWQKGTICLTIAANIGDVAILGIDACFPDSVVGIFSKENDNGYIYYYLTTLKSQFESKASKAAQMNLSVEKIVEFEIPLPSLLEQQQIVRHLDRTFAQLDALHAEQTTRLQHLESLKSSILAEAFQGKL